MQPQLLLESELSEIESKVVRSIQAPKWALTPERMTALTSGLWSRAARALGNLEKKSLERALQREKERDGEVDWRMKEEKSKETI